MTMPLPAILHATITRCRHDQPLVVLDGAPFNGMEVRPQELRLLAQSLHALAERAEQPPIRGTRFRPTRIAIGGEQ
jgi:hypothetical protein